MVYYCNVYTKCSNNYVPPSTVLFLFFLCKTTSSSSSSSSPQMKKPPIIIFFNFYFKLSLLVILSIPSSLSSDLSLNFYSTSCPNVELLVRNAVRFASSVDSTLPGKLVRLLFHDCIVEGCDGSVLVQGNNGTERNDPANRSLGGFQALESAKRLLESLCPGVVSCADILVLAARDAVVISGGPSVQVPLGRRDSRVSLQSNVRPNMVDTGFSLDEMTQIFSSKGLSIDDLVILSGAHTFGSAHCSAFSERFKQDPEGNLALADTDMEKNYAMDLVKKCPTNASDTVTVSNDPVTAFLFDNQYYQNLLDGKGLFRSDSVLFTDERTKGKVEGLARNQDDFFLKWADSFVKLTSVGVKTGGEGEIRKSCMDVNG